MAVKKNQKSLIKKLKKQVRVLDKRANQNRYKLQAALKKLRKQARTFKSRLAAKARMVKSKIAEAQASTYGKAAAGFERQLMKGLEAKGKSLAAAIARIDKKHCAKLAKILAKKGKKVRKPKKAGKAAPVKMRRARRRRSRKGR